MASISRLSASGAAVQHQELVSHDHRLNNHSTSFLVNEHILNVKNLKNVIYLSYIQITGPLDYNTPNEVIREISEAHGIIIDSNRLNESIYRLAIINEINNGKVKKIDLSNMSGKDYRYLARFVNSECNWTIDSLNISINNISRYFNRKINLSKKHFIIGKPVPSSPNRIPISIIYTACLQHHIKIDIKDTLNSLAKKLRLYLDYNPSELCTSIIKNLANFEKQDLVDILFRLNSSNIPCNISSHYTYDELNLAGKKIYNCRFDLNYTPDTHAEAIAYAALVYSIDISSVDNVMAEINALQNKIYHPFDIYLAEKFETKYPRLNSPNLKLVFNPTLPRSCYLDKTLRELAKYEGYQGFESDTYSFLQQAHLSMTFHHGKLFKIINTSTIIEMDDIDDLFNYAVVSYGIRNQDMYAYTYQELLTTFIKCEIYQNPMSETNELFSTLAVDKLISLCDQPQYLDESNDNYSTRLKLSNRIKYINLITNNLSPEAEKLLQNYPNNSDCIKDLLYQLRDLAFYMRGWTGEGAFPVGKAPQKDYNVVEKLSYDTLVKFEHDCSTVGKIGQIILDLPLLDYRMGKFITPHVGNGNTVGDRLNIVKHGDKYPNDTPCIRTTSNLLAFTSYRYLTILDLNSNFDIDKLVIIS